MRKTIKQHEERNVKGAPAEKEPTEAIPAYLLDRANPTTAKALSSQIKNKRAEKAARFSVPIPKVRGISEEELFKVYVLGFLLWEGVWADGEIVSRRARRSRRRVRFPLMGGGVVLLERMLTVRTGWKRVVTKVGLPGRRGHGRDGANNCLAYVCRARLHETPGQVRT
jgi:hypothetical protein